MVTVITNEAPQRLMTPVPEASKRIRGIDSIRFICALTVLLGHFGFPLPESMNGPGAHGVLKYLGILIELLFNGPAAVIVFFIISGFCIHYPYKKTYSVALAPYYSRRLLRIGIPAFLAVLLYFAFDEPLKAPDYAIFWSIICEVIYYLIYPLILLARKVVSWKSIIISTFVLSYILALSNLDLLRVSNGAYTALDGFTWIIGLPCWIMGCWLAENYNRFPLISVKKMWLLRGTILILALGLRIAKFHVPSVFVNNCFTLNAFAIPSCLWFGFEIMYYQNRKPVAFFEWCGKWSYSLYVMHKLVPAILISVSSLSTFESAGAKTILLLVVFMVSLIFYFLVEYPAHRFAGYVSKMLKPVPGK